MAADNADGKKGGGKLSTIIIVLVIILVWLAVFAVLIKFDVGGFGSGVLYPVLKDVPVVNMILPDNDEDVDLDKGESYSSLAQAEQRIKELEKKLEAYESGNTANTDYITQLENEVKNLKVYKDTQDAFEKRVLEFDEKVVFGDEAPSTDEYKAYYEQISPENAEKIYKQVVEQHRYSEKIKSQAEAYAKMEPDKAAAILQQMTAGDLDLVVGILSEMSTAKSSLILAAMDVETAAQVTKKMTYGK